MLTVEERGVRMKEGQIPLPLWLLPEKPGAGTGWPSPALLSASSKGSTQQSD